MVTLIRHGGANLRFDFLGSLRPGGGLGMPGRGFIVGGVAFGSRMSI